MKWTSGKLAAILLLATAGWIGWNMAFPPIERIPWQSDLDAARTLATQQQKPLLIYFTADWCGPCRHMKRNVFTDSHVAAAMEQYVPVKIDVDAQPQVAINYRVNSIPHFVTEDGEREKSASGAMGAQELIDWLRR